MYLMKKTQTGDKRWFTMQGIQWITMDTTWSYFNNYFLLNILLSLFYQFYWYQIHVAYSSPQCLIYSFFFVLLQQHNIGTILNNSNNNAAVIWPTTFHWFVLLVTVTTISVKRRSKKWLKLVGYISVSATVSLRKD